MQLWLSLLLITDRTPWAYYPQLGGLISLGMHGKSGSCLHNISTVVFRLVVQKLYVHAWVRVECHLENIHTT